MAPCILITRAAHQSSALADQLRALGLDPILIPTIELADPTTFAPLDAALAHLDTFHWLLFTSANAVAAFAKRAEKMGAPFIARLHRAMGGIERTPKLAAIGPATARALQAVGLHADLIPPQAVAESLAKSLLPHARQPDATPTRFLLLRAETARDHLPDTLCAAGAEISIAPVYRTIIAAGSTVQLQTLFANRENWPDAITFTSSSTAQNLQALLEESDLRLPPEILRISIGPITSQTLRDLNLTPHAEAQAPTIASLTAAVAKALGLAT
jgi:uroporphyrinogen-III synthase